MIGRGRRVKERALGQEEVASTGLRSSRGQRADTATFHHRAVERVIVAMRECLDDEFSLTDMADLAGMSTYHFNRTFRELTGIPPCRFLSAVRLETAKRLLVETERSVTDVCFDVGYNSLGTFIRRFTELVGVSPQRLRALAKAPLDRVVERLPRRHKGPRPSRVPAVVGLVTAEEPRRAVFIGLFPSPIPQGRPVAGAVTSAPGPYRIPGVPSGRYWLFAACFASWNDPKDLYLYEAAWRGGGQAIWLSNGVTHGRTEVTLRPAALLDPPILVALPLLLEPVPPANGDRTLSARLTSVLETAITS